MQSCGARALIQFKESVGDSRGFHKERPIHALQPAWKYRPVRLRNLPRHHDIRRRRRKAALGRHRRCRPDGGRRDRRAVAGRGCQLHRHRRRLFLRRLRTAARPVAEEPRRPPQGRRDRHQGLWRHGRQAERPRRLARPHHGFASRPAWSGCRPITSTSTRSTPPTGHPDRRDPAGARRSRLARGLVRYVGVSNWQAWRIAKALGISERRGFARFETVQAYYSIAGRDLERDIVPMMNEEKLGLMVWSPLAGGLLSGKYGPGAPGNGEGRRASQVRLPAGRQGQGLGLRRRDARDRRKARRQRRHRGAGLHAGQALRDHGHHRRQAHRAAGPESGGDIADARCRRSEKLDEVSDLAPEYPGWMLARQGAGRRPAPFEPKG
jgi:hypothetical protein